ncbi:other/FunK1 protein kinase [Coprinopsis cinerea AmutBmut pab1-1]|nr:other/FunK1 protein kinase [Coprinopsis cinerea AmutBmut pab1-1]
MTAETRTGSSIPQNQPVERPTCSSRPSNDASGTDVDSTMPVCDGRTRTTESVVGLLKQDLKDACYVGLRAMLTAFWGRMRAGVEGDEQFDAARAFDAFLTRAAGFCNDEASSGVKERIYEALKTRDQKESCAHLARALNLILEHGRGEDVAGFQHTVDDEETVVLVNNPTILKCHPIHDVYDYMPKRKPDLVRLPLSALAPIFPEREGERWEDWVESPFVKHGERVDWGSEGRRTLWRDVVDCWEVRKENVVSEDDLRLLVDRNYQFAIECALDTVDPTPHAAPSVPSPSAGQASGISCDSRKRKGHSDEHSDSDLESWKRVRTDYNSDSDSPHPTASPHAQSGLYALEMMRARWDRTHAIVVLLIDNQLSIQWYDPQGCIRTRPIDIVRQLPLLVATILVFQRFDNRMRGIGGFKLDVEVDGKAIPHTLGDDTRTRWGLTGRRSVGGQLPPCGDLASAVHENKIFGKFLWRAEKQESEEYILETAKRRSVHLGAYKEYVIDHLPCVKAYAEFGSFSTRHIREFMKLPSDGCLVPTGIAAEWLVPINDLPPEEYARAISQLIRCHFLLWQIGIAHGDISPSNLMQRRCPDGALQAVLNDFDLAAIMTPGDYSPNKAGFERTGTKPFMAIDLLCSPTKGRVNRMWYHDFESFLWCLVWYCSDVLRRNWSTGSFSKLAREKYWWLSYAPKRDSDDGVPPQKLDLWRTLLKFRDSWTGRHGIWDLAEEDWEKQLGPFRVFDKYFAKFDSCEDRGWLTFRGDSSMA